MELKKMIVVLAAGCGALAAPAERWRGLGEGAYYSGPKLTEEDLAGKVVLVDCWGVNCPPCRALLPRMEQIWQSFKSKPFVLLGSHRQGRQAGKVAELVKESKLTYPMYDGAGLASGEPAFNAIPFLYVVNHRGKVVYSGHDERAATEAVVTAIGAAGGVVGLTGDVAIKNYKSLEKQLVLGKNVKNVVRTLAADVKKGEAKSANAAQKAKAAEAAELLKAIEAAKDDVRYDIEVAKKRDPAKALKLIADFSVTYPDAAAEYKAELPALKERAKVAAAAKKAAGRDPANAKK